MQPSNLPTPLLSLERAIDHRPLTVTPDTQLRDTISIMGKAKASCVLPSLNLPLDSDLMSAARASCILVVEGSRLVGVFTEGNALQVIASGRDLGDKIADVITQPAIALTQSDSDSQDIFTALSLLRQHQIRHLPVWDHQGRLVGIVTPEGICQVLQPADLLQSRHLAEVMTTPVIHAPATASALSLARLMAEHQVSCVVIVEADSENGTLPMGMVTEHDIVQLQTLELDLSRTQAQTVMSPPLLCLSPSELALVAQWQMQQRVQGVVVSSTGESRVAHAEELLGIVTPTSFLQTLDLTEMSRAVERLQCSINQFEAEKARLLQRDKTDLEPPGQQSAAKLENQLEHNPLDNLIALRIRKSLNLTKLQNQLQYNRLVNGVALRIRKSLDLDEILNTAVFEVRQFLQTDRVFIYRFNPDLSGTVVVESVASGWQPALGSTVKDTCFGKDYAQSYLEGRIQVAEDIYTAGLSQCHINILALFDVRASLVVPLLQGEHLWGLLCAYHCSGPKHWQQIEIDLLKQLATHIAIALQQSELHQQVHSELIERKQIEEALRQSKEDIHTMLEKEKELSELKSSFVTMTSHEFRTPLSMILSSAELIQKYGHKLSEDEKFQYLDRIQTAVKGMTQLLDDVLLVGKAEAGKLEFKPTPLRLVQYCRALVQEIQLSLTHSTDGALTHTIVFRTHDQCTDAYMDEKLLHHILSNLLSNAIKYSPQGSTIHFDLTCKQGEAIFRIQDAGIGIPLADQAKLFDSFHRASNVGSISGTGLGLTIVKKSIDLHGGNITVASEVGVGTIFRVAIPFNNQIVTNEKDSSD